MIEQGVFLARRGMVALSLPFGDAEVEEFVGAVERITATWQRPPWDPQKSKTGKVEMPRKADVPCVDCGRLTPTYRDSAPANRRRCGQCIPRRPARDPFDRWTCRRCGVECSRPATRGQRPKYCSATCQRDHGKRRRQMVLLGAFVEDVDRVAVFEADGYRCYLCGKMTDRTKEVPHRRAPTLEHVVPLSKGGKHERANCRTACYRCNCAKRDRGGGEQFALVLELEGAI